MKQADIDRLKEICEKEGFQVSTRLMDKSVFEITAKDPWEGVEFIRGNGTNTIRKLVNYDGKLFSYFLRDSGNEGCMNACGKSNFKPSTEFEYVEQLKREAFERYGEIKEGTKFDRSHFKSTNQICVVYHVDHFSYNKSNDSFWIGGSIVYLAGVWAKKLPERVEVEINDRVWRGISNGSYDFEFDFNVKNGGTNINIDDCAVFLASQLEKYLNNEINE